VSEWLARAHALLRRGRFLQEEAIYLVGDGVFAAPGLASDAAPRRVASLPDYVADLAARPCGVGVLPGVVLHEARAIAQGLPELRFCLTQLLPALRGGPVAPPPRGLQALERRGAELLQHLEGLPQREAPEAWGKLLELPCAIVMQAVIPLELIGRTPQPPQVAIDGVVYRLRLDAARPLRDLERGVRRETQGRIRSALARDPSVTRLAEETVGSARKILQRTDPSPRAGYELVHQDHTHQLHHASGHWQLVRGPVKGPLAGQPLYLGLHIRGRDRRQRLSRGPVPARTPEGLWNTGGEPRHCGLCMGSTRQYQLLQSRRFTEAEAVMEWLDAGVLLATGRPEFHRRWRKHVSRSEAGQDATP
jgi:hypothetical protein